MTTIEILETKAWVNIQPIQPTKGGTLHVKASINTNNGQKVLLRKKIPQGINPMILLLDFIESPTEPVIKNPQDVHYSEGLTAQGQYTQIDIFFKGEKVTEITEIEIIS